MGNRTGVKSRKSYDADFKQELTTMLMSGRSARELSQSFGIAENLLYRWKSMAMMKTKTKTKTGDSESGKSAKLAAENARLRAENERLKTDREILKKALGLFSKSD
ncbi:transposase [Dyadobacter sp. CY261]|uniref:transposase n=1 Tax=Dyadobacter sp. CY261 TaxID=2907203 RepID=UPI001F47ED83|nr:transposase [Dyadobacter sp. CY261]MCF0075188.1 transposase [Dyadobacter sp. CY261]